MKMKNFTWQLFTMIFVLLVGFSCLSSKKTQSDRSEEEILLSENTVVPDTFMLPAIPENMTNAEVRAQYLVMHYWDRFDFSDTILVQRPEITEQAFVDYINILAYVSPQFSEKSLQYTLEKAAIKKSTYKQFISFFEKYLYEGNSPFRNEEFYIHVLKRLVKSELLGEVEKQKYQFQLDMSNKNRPMQKATDFLYTLASGKSLSMHSIQSEYLIILFSNPGCDACSHVVRQLQTSSVLQSAFSHNSPTRTMLTILTVYPDHDLQLWRNHLPALPPNWINAYDKNSNITKQKLYDLKYIPSIYLLDRNKKVILKDASVQSVENFFTSSIR